MAKVSRRVRQQAGACANVALHTPVPMSIRGYGFALLCFASAKLQLQNTEIPTTADAVCLINKCECAADGGAAALSQPTMTSIEFELFTVVFNRHLLCGPLLLVPFLDPRDLCVCQTDKLFLLCTVSVTPSTYVPLPVGRTAMCGEVERLIGAVTLFRAFFNGERFAFHFYWVGKGVIRR